MDAVKHSRAILSLLVKRLRRKWPKVNLIFRDDSGFCRQKMLNWCDKNNVKYIVGLAKNSRLLEFSKELQDQVALSSTCPNQEILRLIAAKIIAME